MIWLVTSLVKISSWIFIHLPRSFHMTCGRFLGLIWFYIIPIRRKVALENLKRAFPEKSQSEIFALARKNFQNYACGFLEFLLLPCFSKKYFDKWFIIENYDIYLAAKNKQQGVFFLTLHIGSWEFMSAASRFLNIPLHVITKKFKAHILNQVWINLRLDQGIKLIREEKSTFQILRAIRDNEVVGFILDQFMGPPVGVRTTFFGEVTGTPAALALFADRTRAPVVPVYNIRLPTGQIRVIFEDPIEFVEQGSTEQNISLMTQAYTSKIEEIVRKYPDQWLWIHRRWKPFRD